MSKRSIALMVVVVLGVTVMILASRFSFQSIVSSFLPSSVPVCQPGSYLENNECISGCTVGYTYQKISETQQARSPESVTPTVGDASSPVMDTNIEDSANFDFIFTDKVLETQFTASGDNARLIYERATHSMKGQFDINGVTYTCKSMILPEDTDTFAGTECSETAGEIITCSEENIQYSMSYECNATTYAYILKKCSTVPLSIVVSKTGTGSGTLQISSRGVKPSLTTTLTGSNNDITWTATDPAVTITYAAPVNQATTTVSVSGKDITITPGTAAGLEVTGTMRDQNNAPITTPVRMYYAGNYLGNPYYTLDGTSVASPGNGLNGGVVSIQEEWQLTLAPSSDIDWDPKYLAGGGAGTLASLAGEYYPYGHEVQSGNATVATRTSSASQVLAAVAANPTAAALLTGTLAAGNDGTGAVTAMAKTIITLPAETSSTPMSLLDTSMNASYPSGSLVTLTASPVAGSTFTGWGGACTGVDICTIALSSDTTVTAMFTALPKYTLITQKIGIGTISSLPTGVTCGTDCTESYNMGTSVTLTALPVTGSTFTRWTGCNTTSGNTCGINMDINKTVTATFSSVPTYMLTARKIGTGTISSLPAGISCDTDCTELYNLGTVVTLTASPAAGFTFTSWTGCNTTSGNICVVMASMAKTVTATFTRIPPTLYTLTVSRSGTGSGTLSGITGTSQSFAAGTVVTLTPKPSISKWKIYTSTFTGWGGACSGTGICMVTMDANKTVTATFTKK